MSPAAHGSGFHSPALYPTIEADEHVNVKPSHRNRGQTNHSSDPPVALDIVQIDFPELFPTRRPYLTIFGMRPRVVCRQAVINLCAGQRRGIIDRPFVSRVTTNKSPYHR